MFVQPKNFGGSDVFFWRMHEERYGIDTHLHQFAELMLVMDGEIEVTADGRTETADGRTETAHGGQFVLIFPLQPHSFRTPNRVRCWNCVFTPSLTADFFAEWGNCVGEHAVFDGSPFSLDCFRGQLMTEGDLCCYTVKACLYAALSDFSQQVKPGVRKKDENLAEKIIAWLFRSAMKPVTLADAAEELGYSENYLSHRIGKLFGMNFRNLLGCLRAEKAKELLSGTTKTVLEISFECGFESERSFSRSFRRVCGTTPTDYRKMTRSEQQARQFQPRLYRHSAETEK